MENYQFFQFHIIFLWFFSGYGIATPKGSPWRDHLSLAILELQEKGTIQMLYNKWWKNTGDVCTRQVCSTDLGSLIGNTQCGYFRIFVQLRFYVKSILVIVKPQKMPFRPFEQLWILTFWELLTFSRVKLF